MTADKAILGSAGIEASLVATRRGSRLMDPVETRHVELVSAERPNTEPRQLARCKIECRTAVRAQTDGPHARVSALSSGAPKFS
jgi:hypothetical protein